MLFFCLPEAYSQGNAFAFFEYDIRLGMEDQFNNGYEKDLEWHKSQGDDWSWIGWYVINGERRGRFIDATPNHEWKDFDNWKVNGAENNRHNKIHWVPYVENYSGSYRTVLPAFSDFKRDWFTKKFLQVYNLKVIEGKAYLFKEFLNKHKAYLSSKLNGISFVWMQTVSGGSNSEYLLFIATDQVETLGDCQFLFDFPDAEKELRKLYSESVRENIVELWHFSEKLSLISE
ncbi:hypothetical protein V6R21_13655 [Limibacter armeniacum]|uniref:hypothetical protein n=1 Tax=Limibacter armeniacum TaxID=466084 RepID=UPI002FE5DA0B